MKYSAVIVLAMAATSAVAAPIHQNAASSSALEARSAIGDAINRLIKTLFRGVPKRELALEARGPFTSFSGLGSILKTVLGSILKGGKRSVEDISPEDREQLEELLHLLENEPSVKRSLDVRGPFTSFSGLGSILKTVLGSILKGGKREELSAEDREAVEELLHILETQETGIERRGPFTSFSGLGSILKTVLGSILKGGKREELSAEDRAQVEELLRFIDSQGLERRGPFTSFSGLGSILKTVLGSLLKGGKREDLSAEDREAVEEILRLIDAQESSLQRRGPFTSFSGLGSILKTVLGSLLKGGKREELSAEDREAVEELLHILDTQDLQRRGPFTSFSGLGSILKTVIGSILKGGKREELSDEDREAVEELLHILETQESSLDRRGPFTSFSGLGSILKTVLGSLLKGGKRSVDEISAEDREQLEEFLHLLENEPKSLNDLD